MKTLPWNELFLPNTKFGLGSLCLAVVGFKIFIGSGFNQSLVMIHGGLAVVGIGLCLWGTVENK